MQKSPKVPISVLNLYDAAGNKVLNSRNIEKDYINGRYGAIPFIS